MKAHHRRLLLAVIGLAAFIALASGIWFRRLVWQQRFDHNLIAAIKIRDVHKVRLLLEQGANPNAIDRPEVPVTVKNLASKYLGKLRGDKPSAPEYQYPSALMCVYHFVYYAVPGDSHDLGREGSGGGGDELDGPNRADPEPVISALLDHGADLDPAHDVGSTLLTNACICNDLKTISALVKHHVDPNALGQLRYSTKVYPPLL